MFTKNDLSDLRKENCPEHDYLKDIRNFSTDKNKPVSERMNDFIEEVRNPYYFRVGDMAVRIEYSDTRSFEDAFAEALKNELSRIS